MKKFPTTLKSSLFALARVALAFYVIVIVALWFSQELLIFVPSTLAPDHKFDFKSQFQERTFEVNGEKINGLLFKSKTPRGVILYFHGNAGDLSSWGTTAEYLVNGTSWDVWMMDYPGYGKSSGKIRSEHQLTEIANAIYLDVVREYGSNKNIVIFGRSIGSGIATQLAAELASEKASQPKTKHPIAGLVLESPFLSLEKLALNRFSWVPTFVLRYPFRSDLAIAKVKAPILIFHGEKDEVIPFDHGKNLAALATQSALATFTPITSGRHNDLSTNAKYWQALLAFLAPLEK